MTASNSVLDRLDALIRSRSILDHPFYVAWSAGDLTREQLRTYARLYYPHVAAFPGYLRSAIGTTTDHEIRAELEDNLAEELSVPKAHPELWLDFCDELGLDREAVAAAGKSEASRSAVETFERLTEGPIAGALAALYAYESQQPEVSRTKAEGLRGFYGVDSPRALGYFEVHAEADVRHRDGERRALGRCLDAGTSEEDLLRAAGDALDAYWDLLDRVCDAAGIERC